MTFKVFDKARLIAEFGREEDRDRFSVIFAKYIGGKISKNQYVYMIKFISGAKYHNLKLDTKRKK